MASAVLNSDMSYVELCDWYANISDDPKTLNLNNKKWQFVFVLDIDETLVHCNMPCQKPTHRMHFDGQPLDEFTDIELYVRKGALEIIKFLKDKGHCVIIWTAGNKTHAQMCTQIVDPNHIADGVIYREDLFTWYFPDHAKDIALLARFCVDCDPRRIIIIDNNHLASPPHSSHFNQHLCVLDFKGDIADDTLDAVIALFSRLSIQQLLTNGLATDYNVEFASWYDTVRTRDCKFMQLKDHPKLPNVSQPELVTPSVKLLDQQVQPCVAIIPEYKDPFAEWCTIHFAPDDGIDDDDGDDNCVILKHVVIPIQSVEIYCNDNNTVKTFDNTTPSHWRKVHRIEHFDDLCDQTDDLV